MHRVIPHTEKHIKDQQQFAHEASHLFSTANKTSANVGMVTFASFGKAELVADISSNGHNIDIEQYWFLSSNIMNKQHFALFEMSEC